MLAILVLAQFAESVDDPADEFVRRWNRAVSEASVGISPLMDLRAALMLASRHIRFPLPDLRSLNVRSLRDGAESDDAPWVTAFLASLDQRPTIAEAGIAEVCELLLERHARESSTSRGEYYTPRSVTRLLIELMPPQPGDRVLDPACGSGGLLAAAAQSIAAAGPVDGASIEAYATDRSNPPLAMMNLAIHGVDRPLVRVSDPTTQFRNRGNDLFDFVLGNPPFNQRIENTVGADWPFGTPPESSANFAWLQLAWSRLSESGIAGMIMPPAAAWSNGIEAEIRKRMIASGALLGIVALPPNLFIDTAIPVHLWFLARDKSRHLPGDDANSILFIDASRLGTQAPRQPRELTAEDVQRIVGRFHAWRRSPRATPDEVGFSRSVTHKEILENNGSLDPRLYVEIGRERSTTAMDVSRMVDELSHHEDASSSSIVDVRRSFSMCERLTHNGIKPQRLPLLRIVSGVTESLFEEPTPGLLFAGPSGSHIRAEHYVTTDGIPVVMPQDLTNSGFDTTNIRYIPEHQAERLDRFRLRRGDVVMARRGELGRCAVVRDEQQGWVCGTGCFVLRPPATLDADYFAAYLRSAETREWLEAHSTGSMTMKTISLQVLGELPVVLPDLGIQQAIAEAMVRLDDHEQLLREQLALTQRIRRGALNGLLADESSTAEVP
jgi:type I restriction enzyme M protein